MSFDSSQRSTKVARLQPPAGARHVASYTDEHMLHRSGGLHSCQIYQLSLLRRTIWVMMAT